ncbi:MAG: ADP-heptose--LPS heptosyltransferase RfaF [Flavobacteriales bacterium]|nr:MAG: ADP-heptose--LPS heptosyltransferase RfaF [Flavobacteriales bacterium]
MNSHILVIRLSAMGDVAMTVPVLRAFAMAYPNVKITVLTRAAFKPFFKNIPNLEVFIADLNKSHKGLAGLYKLYRQIQSLSITHIADLHNVLRSKILLGFFTFSNIKMAIIDKGRAEKKALTRERNKIFKPLKTTHQRYADVFEKLGFPVDISQPVFPDKTILSEKILDLIGTDYNYWIGFAPFAKHPGKMYPLDLVKKVLKKLLENKNYKIILFGGGDKEQRELSKMAKLFNCTFSIAGKLSMEEELSLISNLDLMVSMDSGNGHLAAMQGVKVISIWGVTHPYAGFAPYNQPIENQLIPDREKYPKLPCSVYGNKICEDYEDVMRDISPKVIVEKINEVLEK